MSLSFCHHAPVALARWQQNEKTVTGMICVLDDFCSSAFATFEVDVCAWKPDKKLSMYPF